MCIILLLVRFIKILQKIQFVAEFGAGILTIISD